MGVKHWLCLMADNVVARSGFVFKGVKPCCWFLVDKSPLLAGFGFAGVERWRCDFRPLSSFCSRGLVWRV